MVAMQSGGLYNWLKCNICIKHYNKIYIFYMFMWASYTLFIVSFVLSYSENQKLMIYKYFQLFDMKFIEDFIASFSYFSDPFRVAGLTVIIFPVVLFNILNVVFLSVLKRKLKLNYHRAIDYLCGIYGKYLCHVVSYISVFFLVLSFIYVFRLTMLYDTYSDDKFYNLSAMLFMGGFFLSNVPCLVVTLKWDIKTFRHKLRLLRYRRRFVEGRLGKG